MEYSPFLLVERSLGRQLFLHSRILIFKIGGVSISSYLLRNENLCRGIHESINLQIAWKIFNRGETKLKSVEKEYNDYIGTSQNENWPEYVIWFFQNNWMPKVLKKSFLWKYTRSREQRCHTLHNFTLQVYRKPCK